MPGRNFTGLLKPSAPKKSRRASREDDLINAESELGRNIFGPIPEGHKREFFHHQKNVWIWHENGTTIRYEVRPHGVYKRVMGSDYHKITGKELENFRNATKNYLELVKKHLYK